MALIRAGGEAFKPRLQFAIELAFALAFGDRIILIGAAPMEGDGALAGAFADTRQRTLVGGLYRLAERRRLPFARDDGDDRHRMAHRERHAGSALVGAETALHRDIGQGRDALDRG